MTCISNSKQIRSFYKLQQIKENAESLFELRHSFITLCLDIESYPESYADAAYLTHCSNYENRWFHASLQLVVFGNAKACAVFNFTTYLDGNTMTRSIFEIQKRSEQCVLPNDSNRMSSVLLKAKELKWLIPANLLLKAQRAIRPILDTQQATFRIDSIGNAFFETHNVAAVPAFILALQMTAKRFTGKMAKISQFLSMSKFRCMDLLTTTVTTPEVIEFVNFMDGKQKDDGTAMELMQKAIDSQAQACRLARRNMALDDFLPLFIRLNHGIKRLFTIFIVMSTNFILKILGHLKTEEREILVSHPVIYPKIPVFGRPGIRLPYVKYFGLHYQIYDHNIVVTMMPSTTWRVPNAELISVLTESLVQIKQVIIKNSRGMGKEDRF